METFTLICSEAISIICLIHDLYIYFRVKKFIILSSENDICMYLKNYVVNGNNMSSCTHPVANNRFIKNGKLCPRQCRYKVGCSLGINASEAIKKNNPISIIRLVGELAIVCLLALTMILNF